MVWTSVQFENKSYKMIISLWMKQSSCASHIKSKPIKHQSVGRIINQDYLQQQKQRISVRSRTQKERTRPMWDSKNRSQPKRGVGRKIAFSYRNCGKGHGIKSSKAVVYRIKNAHLVIFLHIETIYYNKIDSVPNRWLTTLTIYDDGFHGQSFRRSSQKSFASGVIETLIYPPPLSSSG